MADILDCRAESDEGPIAKFDWTLVGIFTASGVIAALAIYGGWMAVERLASHF